MNLPKKLRNILALSSVGLILGGCPSATTGSTSGGNQISLSPCYRVWGSDDIKEELNEPLSSLSGCDILTRRTLEDIINNNEKLGG